MCNQNTWWKKCLCLPWELTDGDVVLFCVDLISNVFSMPDLSQVWAKPMPEFTTLIGRQSKALYSICLLICVCVFVCFLLFVCFSFFWAKRETLAVLKIWF